MSSPAEGQAEPGRIARDGVWWLDDLRVDAGRRIVRRGADIVAVSGLSFDLLLALIESAPNLVTNDELMDRVWGKVVVSPETLTQRVKLLRNALGDDPRNPRYLAGVRGRGYRLLSVPERLRADTEYEDPNVSPGVTAWTGHEAVTRNPGSTPGAGWRTRSQLSLIAALVAGAIAVLGVYWLVSQRGTGTTPATTDAVAIMPFTNVDGSEAGATLAKGMAEALLHRLAGLHGMAVISRYSSFALSDKGLTAREIGDKLDARYLLEGSVQGSIRSLRVRTALTDVRNGNQLWSLQFDRGPEDLLAIQDEIAAKVTQTLGRIDDRAGAEPQVAKGTSSAAAQLAFLQGTALAGRMVIADLDQSLQRFDEAIRVDPAFASAHAAAAASLLTREELRDDQRIGRQNEQLEEAARRVKLALDADPGNAEALVVRARIAALRGEFEAAENDFYAAIAARPNDAEGHLQFSRFLFYRLDPFENQGGEESARKFQARYASALEQCDQAARLDPLSPAARFVRGQMSLHLGEQQEAESYLEQALGLDPNFPPALGRLSQLRWLRGELADAVVYGERALAIDPGAEWIRRFVSQYYVELGDTRSAESVLAEGGPGLADGRLALLLREQQWREAGEIALADRTRQPRTLDRDLSAFALVTWVRFVPEDTGQVLEALQGRVGWKSVGDTRSIHHGSRFAALAAADLLIANGRESEGMKLVDDVIRAAEMDLSTRIDSASVAPVRADRRALAWALALQGDPAGALNQLEAAIRSSQLRHLWYDLEVQPTFENLRREPRFAALLDEYHARIGGERQKLEVLRAQGAAPKRWP